MRRRDLDLGGVGWLVGGAVRAPGGCWHGKRGSGQRACVPRSGATARCRVCGGIGRHGAGVNALRATFSRKQECYALVAAEAGRVSGTFRWRIGRAAIDARSRGSVMERDREQRREASNSDPMSCAPRGLDRRRGDAAMQGRPDGAGALHRPALGRREGSQGRATQHLRSGLAGEIPAATDHAREVRRGRRLKGGSRHSEWAIVDIGGQGLPRLEKGLTHSSPKNCRRGGVLSTSTGSAIVTGAVRFRLDWPNGNERERRQGGVRHVDFVSARADTYFATPTARYGADRHTKLAGGRPRVRATAATATTSGTSIRRHELGNPSTNFDETVTRSGADDSIREDGDGYYGPSSTTWAGRRCSCRPMAGCTRRLPADGGAVNPATRGVHLMTTTAIQRGREGRPRAARGGHARGRSCDPPYCVHGSRSRRMKTARRRCDGQVTGRPCGPGGGRGGRVRAGGLGQVVGRAARVRAAAEGGAATEGAPSARGESSVFAVVLARCVAGGELAQRARGRGAHA